MTAPMLARITHKVLVTMEVRGVDEKTAMASHGVPPDTQEGQMVSMAVATIQGLAQGVGL